MGVAFTASVTWRERKRRLSNGSVVRQSRYVVNYRCPNTGRRTQQFFESHREAIAERDRLIASVATQSYAPSRSDLTIGQAVDRWLEHRRTTIKPGTWSAYKSATSYIVRPILVGTPRERRAFTETGKHPATAEFLPPLAPIRIADLTTGAIRSWHAKLVTHVSNYSANLAQKFLRAALLMAAEDFQLRVPPMPSKYGRGRPKPVKAILSPEQVGVVLKAASEDKAQGIYYAFPFLTGVRPSEQLALHWEDVDLDRDMILIRRMQELSGALTPLTKTPASTREIPISPLLRKMLLEWRLTCPRLGGQLRRVFPGQGRSPVTGLRCPLAGRPLCYTNFRNRYWVPMFARLGLPYVTPHSARHAFISTLQAKGIEVGLVAKLAGHSNAAVTLSHYTQAVRGGDVAVRALEEAYWGRQAG
jgi:integrase